MKYSYEKGFTLIEIIIIIIIISMISTFFIPKIADVYDITLEAAIDNIVYDLRWSRIQAILNNKNYYFRIYRKDNIYKIDKDYRSDYIIYTINKDDEIIIEKEGSFSAKYTLYKNVNPVKIEDDYYDRIMFTPFGTAKMGTIGLKSHTEKLIKITINIYGRIRIEYE